MLTAPLCSSKGALAAQQLGRAEARAPLMRINEDVALTNSTLMQFFPRPLDSSLVPDRALYLPRNAALPLRRESCSIISLMADTRDIAFID